MQQGLLNSGHFLEVFPQVLLSSSPMHVSSVPREGSEEERSKKPLSNCAGERHGEKGQDRGHNSIEMEFPVLSSL